MSRWNAAELVFVFTPIIGNTTYYVRLIKEQNFDFRDRAAKFIISLVKA